jgi:AraC-like DNA-binding protein
MNQTRPSTPGPQAPARPARAGEGAPGHAAGDIRVRGTRPALLNLDAPWRAAERHHPVARPAPAGLVVVCRVIQDGARFRGGDGDDFAAGVGAIVVGRHDPHGPAAPPDWRVQALSAPAQLLAFSADALARAGFRLVPGPTPLNRLLAAHVDALHRELPALDAQAAAAAWRALDQLLALALARRDAADDEPDDALARQRRRAARRHIDAHMESAALSPAGIAASLGISTRQLQRSFERAGVTLTGEIRHLRAQRALALIASRPELSITGIALRCGFESLATFYRAFKIEFGMTASDARRGARHPLTSASAPAAPCRR